MMRLSTLWTIAATIDAERRLPLADQVLAAWPHDPASARLVRLSANIVCRFTHRGERQFLRLAAPGERARTAIDAEVALVAWLAEAGLPVARPLPSRAGALVETMTTDLGIVHAVVFAGLDGVHPALSDLDDAAVQAWGAALGRLHATLRRYPDRASPARGSWRDHLDFIQTYIPPNQPAVQRECDRLGTVMAALPVDADDYGLIHFDFELDNLCWRDRTVGILDFDDCAHYWYAADIAFALRDLFADGATLDHPSCQTFVRGYRTRHPLNDALLAQTPLFIQLANLLQYARLVRALDLPAAPDQPAWLDALRRKFEQRVATYPATL